MNALDFVNSVEALIKSGATVDQIAAAVTAQQAALLDAQTQAEKLATDAAAAQAAIDAKLALCTPVMLSNIGLTNGMTQADVLAKIDFYYPNLLTGG